MVDQPKLFRITTFEPRPILDDISVVIPTLGRAILEENFYHLANGSCWPKAVIIVDQSSSKFIQGMVDKWRGMGIDGVHIQSTKRGRASGLNIGLKALKTPYFAVTDDDCFVDPNWLLEMASNLRTYPDTIMTGRVDPAGQDMIVVVDSQEPAVYTRPRLKFDSMSGGNMGSSVQVLQKVGYFDDHPSLATSEDGEWAYRALRSGVQIRYEPKIIVKHFGWREEPEREVQYRGYARSHGGFYGKYLRRGDLFIALRALLHHVRALRRWVRGMLFRDEEMAMYGRAYFLGLLPGIIAGLKR